MCDHSVQVVSQSALPCVPTFRSSLVRTPEGRLLVAGTALAVIYLLGLAASPLFSKLEPHLLFAMTATEIVLGRAAALALGYSSDLGHATVILVCMIVETILVLIFYPLFIFSWNSLLVFKGLAAMFHRIRSAAEAHKGRVQKFGIIGLFLFVWLPFWMTGPVVGCVIGFLLGLRTWLNITVVLTGTYAAILGWAFFLRGVQERLAAYGSYAGVAAVVAVVGVFFILQRVHRKINGSRNGR